MQDYDKYLEANNLTASVSPGDSAAGEPGPLQVSPADERFRSCRWHRAAENGTPACCEHRDVLPLTGTSGFQSESWCPGCALYKLRRTPRKREFTDDRYDRVLSR